MPPISFKFGAASSGSSSASLYAGILGGDKRPEEDTAVHEPVASTSAALSEAKGEYKDETPAPTPAKSAALAFGPVRKRPIPAAKARPTAASFMSAAPSTISAPAVTYSAPPVLLEEQSNDSTKHEEKPVAASGWAKKPTGGPPPMTLPDGEEDINGFQKTAAGKKAAKKSRKKKKNRQEEDPTRDFNADYDPAKPNDYAEWKAYCQHKKEEAREARRRAKWEEEERKRREEEENDSGSYETGSESEDEKPRTQGRFFAPPASYDTPAVSSEPVAIALQETGEEAYARRLALSNQASEPAVQSLPTPPTDSDKQAKEDAFARAMAISQSLKVADDQDELLPHASEASASPVPSPALPQAVLDAQAKARAIAERLGKLGAMAPQPKVVTPSPAFVPSSSEKKRPREEDEEEQDRPNPQAFAERLMAKYGWKKGQGLGANETGIVNALSVAPAPSASGSKQSPQQAQRGPIGMQGGGRGVIVSETKEAKDKEDKARYGSPSRIAVLTNMVGRAEVDDDLANEIAEEARKHGIVEGCKIHPMPFNTAEEESVRIFVFFSGEVGAWKAVKEFDGRFFNGRVVRARFYDEWKVTNGRELYGMPFETS